MQKEHEKDKVCLLYTSHFGKNVPVLLVPVIFVSTVLTHLGGGSAGREGAASVSYTHLDVYKRQAFMWPSDRRSPRSPMWCAS